MEKQKTLPDYVRARLREQLPETALKPHPTKDYITVIDPYHVIERLNNIFGIGGWKYTIEEKWREGKDAIVQLRLDIPAYNISIHNFGGNNNIDPGDGYKGAVTDALTKCASFLEIGIEIYTGRADRQAGPARKPPARKDDDTRPWLTEDQYGAMLGAILDGKGDQVRERMENYRMKKAYRENLNKALSDGSN